VATGTSACGSRRAAQIYEFDFIRDWVVSSQNQSLADSVVYIDIDGRSVEAIALDIAKRVQE